MTTIAPQPHDFLTTEEVAAVTRTSIDTVRYWRTKGIGPQGARVGKRILYRREDVDTWLRDRFEAALREGK